MTRNYKRKTNALTLAAAFSQGAQDHALGFPPTANPYTQRNYRASYASGYDAALLKSAWEKVEGQNAPPELETKPH